MKRVSGALLVGLLTSLVSACGDPIGLRYDHAPLIRVAEATFDVERDTEFVTTYSISNPGPRRIHVRLHCKVRLDRLGELGWEAAWGPTECLAGMEPPVVIEPGAELVGLFAAGLDTEWEDGVFRLRFDEVALEPRRDGARVSLPEEWRVSHSFELRAVDGAAGESF